ncbi:MAG: hypothetical protein J6K39_03385 [Clostridia bacterium]|nr:hypothetical protein [Clostridia bacterium]
MSRTFSKIMVVCAMVILLPLMVVCTAFAAYNAIDAIVNVKTIVDVKSVDQSVYASVMYDGESNETFTIKKGHTQKAEIKAHYSKAAYEFLGWFVGDEKKYESAKANNTVELNNAETLSFNMTDAENYLAVYEIVKYDVSYDYPEDPEVDIDDVFSTTAPEGGKYQYNYGEALPTLTTTNPEYYFAGWVVNGARYTTATFAQADTYVLAHPWLEVEKVAITFKAGDTVLKTEDVIKDQTYVLPTVEDLIAGTSVENSYKVAGYTYSWAINGATVTQINPTAACTVEIKATPIQYTATLKYDASLLAEGQVVEAVTFTVEDYDGFDAWFNLDLKYSFTSIKGFNFKNGTTDKTVLAYGTGASLAEFVAEDFPTTSASVEIEMLINSDYSSLKVTGTTSFKAGSGSIFNKDVYKLVDVNGVEDYEVVEGLDGAQKLGTQTIKELLDVEGTTLAASNGDGTYTEVKLVALIVNGHELSVPVDGRENVYDLIEALLANGKTSAVDGEVFTINSLQACFETI